MNETLRATDARRKVEARLVRRAKRVLLALAAATTALVLGCLGIFAAWLAGVHVPLASGATYLRVEKLAPLSAADRVGGGPTSPFFILLVGNDSRPGVGGARGDALHVLGVNPAKHQATMLDIPRDTCWNGDKINAGNTQGPRAQAERRRRPRRRADLVRRRRRLRRLHRSRRRRRRRRRATSRRRCTTRTRARTSVPGTQHMNGTQALVVLARPPRLPDERHRPHAQPGTPDPRRDAPAPGEDAERAGRVQAARAARPPRAARRHRHQGPVPPRAGCVLAEPRPDPEHHDAVHGRQLPRPRRGARRASSPTSATTASSRARTDVDGAPGRYPRLDASR